MDPKRRWRVSTRNGHDAIADIARSMAENGHGEHIAEVVGNWQRTQLRITVAKYLLSLIAAVVLFSIQSPPQLKSVPIAIVARLAGDVTRMSQQSTYMASPNYPREISKDRVITPAILGRSEDRHSVGNQADPATVLHSAATGDPPA